MLEQALMPIIGSKYVKTDDDFVKILPKYADDLLNFVGPTLRKASAIDVKSRKIEKNGVLFRIPNNMVEVPVDDTVGANLQDIPKYVYQFSDFLGNIMKVKLIYGNYTRPNHSGTAISKIYTANTYLKESMINTFKSRNDLVWVKKLQEIEENDILYNEVVLLNNVTGRLLEYNNDKGYYVFTLRLYPENKTYGYNFAYYMKTLPEGFSKQDIRDILESVFLKVPQTLDHAYIDKARALSDQGFLLDKRLMERK